MRTVVDYIDSQPIARLNEPFNHLAIEEPGWGRTNKVSPTHSRCFASALIKTARRPQAACTPPPPRATHRRAKRRRSANGYGREGKIWASVGGDVLRRCQLRRRRDRTASRERKGPQGRRDRSARRERMIRWALRNSARSNRCYKTDVEDPDSVT
jgi:hypothetical protein